jgi:UDP-N-acetylglucosamine/UDP-N-acetylgalactosamine diphosphorylase
VTAAARLEAAGQQHLVRHATDFAAGDRERFLTEAAAFPWEALAAARDAPAPPPRVLRPPLALTLGRQRGVAGLRERLRRLGEGLLAGGRVATVLLAGGDGSRLGLSGPKGSFVLGPEPDRTLYAILAEHVAAAGRRAARPVPLYVLTSPGTEAATREAFAEGAERWGLAEGQVVFLSQGRLPVTDPEGRALLAGPGRLLLAPDGHGGLLEALLAAGILEDLEARGVDVLTTFQVDNPLSRPLDPVLLGWMVERRLDLATKGVRRLEGEKVGVLARDLEGRLRIVEYSELPAEGLPEGLVYGSVALHAFGVRWLRRALAEGGPLPLHVARKRATCWRDGGGEEAVEALKHERFLFDVFPRAPRAEVQEVVREREFAPVKNAEGPDSPETARALVAAEARRREAEGGPTGGGA